MANYATIIAAIEAAIYSNDNVEITGDVLQVVLKDMVSSLGAGYQFKGIATPSTEHGTPDAKVWYIAPADTYENFGASSASPFIVAPGEIGVFSWDSEWHRETIPTVEIVDNLFDGGSDKALSAEAGKFLQGVIGYDGEPVNLDQLTEQNCGLGATAWYYSEGTGKHKAIPVTPGERITLCMRSYDGHETGNYDGWYVFVTSAYNPPYSNGSTVPATGSQVRLPARVGTVIEQEAPANAAYLIITTEDGSGVMPEWEVSRYVIPSETLTERTESLEEQVGNLETTVEGVPQQITGTWGDFQLSTTSLYARAFVVCNDKAVLNGVVTVKLSDYSNYKVGVVIQAGTSWSSTVISDTGWRQQDITKVIGVSERGYFIRVTIGKVSNADITLEEALAVLSQLSYVYTAGVGGLVGRVDNLEEASLHAYQRIPMKVLGTAVYAGKKVDVEDHSYTCTELGSLTSVGTARQGAAVFGDYLFQCHNTNNAIVVFKISTGQSIQTINLTANPDNHANSASFGGQYYHELDQFPCLYVSSEGESKTYVYRITGSEGAFSLSLVQVLTYSVNFYYPNLHVDAPNNRGVVVGYAVNSWQSATGNEMMGCCFDLPSVTSGNATLSGPYNEFTFPFIYATQGAFGKYGKLYHAFGNTSEGLKIGGIIIYDYILHNMETFIDLKAAGNLEPEGLGIYDGGLVFTTQGGGVLQLTF